MENELTLRDELAISMELETLPKIENQKVLDIVAEKFGLEWDEGDPIKQIEFGLAYESIIRYQYADAMLKARLS